MSKLLIFGLLWWMIGNPIIAVLALLFIFYVLDRRFIGILPSLVKPFKQRGIISKLGQELLAQPYNTSVKIELARLLMMRHKYAKALPYLEEAHAVIEESADVMCGLGICHLKLGNREAGERWIMHALELNPRVQYGEPYLRLAEAWAGADAEKAIGFLNEFRNVQSSSCEAYFRLGQLYDRLGRKAEARASYRETGKLYRSLPRYKKRAERRWALFAILKR